MANFDDLNPGGGADKRGTTVVNWAVTHVAGTGGTGGTGEFAP